jgi:hypothetical protein
MTKRILTIDGGGLRGVFSAAVIEQIEAKCGDQPACEIFDAFVGTSAGSVIAAGLAKGMRAAKLKDIFIRIGQQMSGLMGEGGDGAENAARRQQKREKASAALEHLLKEILGEETTAGQLKRRFAVVTRNMERDRVEFMGNFPSDQLESPSFWKQRGSQGADEPVWRMVLRSAALPPVFAAQGSYLDGGVSPFANPAYAAYIGVQRCLGWNPWEEELQFFSVGTGYHTTHQKLTTEDDQPIGDEAMFAAMVGAMMQDINFLQHQLMKRLRAPGHVGYQRYNIAFNEQGFERAGVELDDLGDEAKADPKGFFEKLAKTATPCVKELAEIGKIVGEKTVKREHFSAGGRGENDPSTAYIPFGAPDQEALRQLRQYAPDPGV